MIVYHGSYCIVDKPHINFSRESLDFGKGFYVTTIEEQAINWTKKFKLKGQNSYVNLYDLPLDTIKNYFIIKDFKYYNTEWLDFILDCRNGSDCFTKYDIIIGGIADDRVYNTIELYEDSLISKDEALKRLKFYKPNNQICIVNQQILDNYLQYIQSKEV